MSDALDRLKQRSRPKVTPRDASMTSTPQDIQTPRHTEVQTTPEVSNIPQPATSQTSTGLEVSESRHTDIGTYKNLEAELETKRSTFRMEANLIDRLHTLCRHQGISREVFIEAMFEYVEAHPEALEQVLGEADQKNDYRQQLANRKRAEAMMQKFGGA